MISINNLLVVFYFWTNFNFLNLVITIISMYCWLYYWHYFDSKMWTQINQHFLSSWIHFGSHCDSGFLPYFQYRIFFSSTHSWQVDNFGKTFIFWRTLSKTYSALSQALILHSSQHQFTRSLLGTLNPQTCRDPNTFSTFQSNIGF